MSNTHTYSKREEIANAATHGVGIVLSTVALVLLITLSVYYGSVQHVVSFTVFGATMVLLYVCSTLLHSLPEGKAKDIFEILDHSSIYVFIAGSYTPILMVAIKGTLGWTLLGVVWGLAIAGVIFKAFFTKRFLFTSTLLYILMGWMIVIAWKPLFQSVTTVGVSLLIIGGLFYTVGTLFYMWRAFPYHHAVWHLFVVAGTIFHFFSVLSMLPSQGTI